MCQLSGEQTYNSSLRNSWKVEKSIKTKMLGESSKKESLRSFEYTWKTREKKLKLKSWIKDSWWPVLFKNALHLKRCHFNLSHFALLLFLRFREYTNLMHTNTNILSSTNLTQQNYRSMVKASERVSFDPADISRLSTSQCLCAHQNAKNILNVTKWKPQPMDAQSYPQ